MQKFIDITLSISLTLPIWPGDPPLQMDRMLRIENGDIANVTVLHGGVHIGTHVDAPYHFLAEGRCIDQLRLEELIGPVEVIEIDPRLHVISAELLQSIEIRRDIRRILFKTRNSLFWAKQEKFFQNDYVALDLSAAEYLVEKGIQLVGIDYLSIAPMSCLTGVHRALLGADIIVVEGVNLTNVEAGSYQLICLPIKLAGADGAFARVVLVSE